MIPGKHKALFVSLIFLPACLATVPLHPEARRHNRVGVDHLRAGDLHRAEVCFRLSLEYNPCHADALHNLALLYLMRDRPDRAEGFEREAVSCDPELVQAVNGMGVILLRQGKPSDALVHFEEAVKMDPGYLDARRNLILTALETGNLDLAKLHALRLEHLSPGDEVVEAYPHLLAPTNLER